MTARHLSDVYKYDIYLKATLCPLKVAYQSVCISAKPDGSFSGYYTRRNELAVSNVLRLRYKRGFGTKWR